MGEIVKTEFEKMNAKHACVGDVRCIGLFNIVELVNKETREPLVPYNPKPSELGAMPFNQFLRENGIFTLVRWNTFFVIDLTINETQLREALDVMDRGLDIIDASLA
jgi:taurine--2-oxoglutarate transaminase